MNERDSVLNYILRNALASRNLSVLEGATFKIGRRKFILDFYLKEQKLGIITINWKRTIPTNKLLQLEDMIVALELEKLVLICNSISSNAKDFLSRREIPIQIIRLSDIINKASRIEDFILSCS
ncbi:MAG: hypothetical protein KAS95_00990 [Candidatus Heimdallarchaeota archaeon]|nr:hypothetical protein [Candidatus Heimdallarchaeota archaeon]